MPASNILLYFNLPPHTHTHTHTHIKGTFKSHIYIYAFSRRFYPKRLTIAFRLYIFISICVPWESNPQPFALLTQCSTTEPHRNSHVYVRLVNLYLSLCSSLSLSLFTLLYLSIFLFLRTAGQFSCFLSN